MKRRMIAILSGMIILTAGGCGNAGAAETDDSSKMDTVAEQNVLDTEVADTNEAMSENDTEKVGTEAVDTEASDTTEAAAEDDTEKSGEKLSVNLYLGNDNADGFVIKECAVEEINEKELLSLLIENGVLPDDVEINHFSKEEDTLKIDFNEAFSNYLQNQGTAGEYIVIGTVVNTYLDAFEAEEMTITFDGKTLETGHVVYDGPLSRYQ